MTKLSNKLPNLGNPATTANSDVNSGGDDLIPESDVDTYIAGEMPQDLAKRGLDAFIQLNADAIRSILAKDKHARKRMFEEAGIDEGYVPNASGIKAATSNAGISQ